MTSPSQRSFHTVGSEWLGAYSSGSMTDAKRLVLECQMAMQKDLAKRVERIDEIGGAFIETAKGESLSSGFSSALSNAIADVEMALTSKPKAAGSSKPIESWVPAPLKEYLEESEIELVWRRSGPGVERAALLDDGQERLYLLKARPGLKLPSHSHFGQEWTLILQGGYHVGEKSFIRGDLHSEDETCTHQPVIDDDGEACISLVVDEGRLVFSNPILKLLQPLIRI